MPPTLEEECELLRKLSDSHISSYLHAMYGRKPENIYKRLLLLGKKHLCHKYNINSMPIDAAVELIGLGIDINFIPSNVIVNIQTIKKIMSDESFHKSVIDLYSRIPKIHTIILENITGKGNDLFWPYMMNIIYKYRCTIMYDKRTSEVIHNCTTTGFPNISSDKYFTPLQLEFIDKFGEIFYLEGLSKSIENVSLNPPE